MKCPSCKETVLVISERKGIEIDYCPDCRGIWLDRGELDKILEKSKLEDASDSRDHNQFQNQPHHSQQKHYYKKRKSFFEELFD